MHVVKQYIPHKAFTHFVKPSPVLHKSYPVLVNQPPPPPTKHFVFYHDAYSPDQEPAPYPPPTPPTPSPFTKVDAVPPLYQPVPLYPDDPPVYKYSYSVNDDYTGTLINVDESRDVDHTKGSYKVMHCLKFMLTVQSADKVRRSQKRNDEKGCEEQREK